MSGPVWKDEMWSRQVCHCWNHVLVTRVNYSDLVADVCLCPLPSVHVTHSQTVALLCIDLVIGLPWAFFLDFFLLLPEYKWLKALKSLIHIYLHIIDIFIYIYIIWPLHIYLLLYEPPSPLHSTLFPEQFRNWHMVTMHVYGVSYAGLYMYTMWNDPVESACLPLSTYHFFYVEKLWTLF